MDSVKDEHGVERVLTAAGFHRHDVDLTPEELRRITLWPDCNSNGAALAASDQLGILACKSLINASGL